MFMIGAPGIPAIRYVGRLNTLSASPGCGHSCSDCFRRVKAESKSFNLSLLEGFPDFDAIFTRPK